MPIVSSTIREDAIQSDGRRHVREVHADHTGAEHHRIYLAESGQDVTGGLAERAAELEAALRAGEIQTNATAIESDDSPTVTTRHSTLLELAQEIRERFRTATGVQAARIAARLLTLTDAQLRNLFGLTQTQVTQLRTRLQAKVDKWTALRAEAGE